MGYLFTYSLRLFELNIGSSSQAEQTFEATEDKVWRRGLVRIVDTERERRQTLNTLRELGAQIGWLDVKDGWFEARARVVH